MGDLGYLVTYSAADPYFLLLMLRAGPSALIVITDDIMRLPISVLDASGRVVGRIPPKR